MFQDLADLAQPELWTLDSSEPLAVLIHLQARLFAKTCGYFETNVSLLDHYPVTVGT